MGLQYENLDAATRTLMLEEIEFDLAGTGLYVSRFLNERGKVEWPDLTRSAARDGTDDTLAAALARGLLESHYSKNKPKGGTTMAAVPYTAPSTMAEGQFNMYYMRALSRRVLAGEAKGLVVYRAKAVDVPRSSSERMIGTQIDAQLVLDELRRTKGVDPDIRIPLPNSGLTVRLV